MPRTVSQLRYGAYLAELIRRNTSPSSDGHLASRQTQEHHASPFACQDMPHSSDILTGSSRAFQSLCRGRSRSPSTKKSRLPKTGGWSSCPHTNFYKVTIIQEPCCLSYIFMYNSTYIYPDYGNLNWTSACLWSFEILSKKMEALSRPPPPTEKWSHKGPACLSSYPTLNLPLNIPQTPFKEPETRLFNRQLKRAPPNLQELPQMEPWELSGSMPRCGVQGSTDCAPMALTLSTDHAHRVDRRRVCEIPKTLRPPLETAGATLGLLGFWGLGCLLYRGLLSTPWSQQTLLEGSCNFRTSPNWACNPTYNLLDWPYMGYPNHKFRYVRSCCSVPRVSKSVPPNKDQKKFQKAPGFEGLVSGDTPLFNHVLSLHS